MARIVAEAVDAGAVGVSTSRTIVHRAVDGEPVPGTFAAEDELFALGRALARVGRGVFELAPAGIQGEDLAAPDKELDWMRRLAKETQRPVTYGFVQHDVAPDDWKRLLDLAGAAVDDDVPLRPQVAGRPIGLLLGLQTFHPLSSRPTFAATAARATSLDDLVARLSDPSVRERILGEEPAVEMPAYIALTFDRIFELGDPPDYEPARDESIAARAARAEVPADAMFYDLLLGRAGRQLLLRPLLGYSDFTLEPLREMLEHPASVLGIGDGGAHVRAICDASNPTFMLTHWVRDRTRGPRLPLEMVIHKMTGNNADLYGLHDRGTIAVGKKADLNVIDLAALRLHSPEFVNDLPADAGRLVQGASGYRATIVSGETIRRDGTDTGARPGRLVRSRS
jgi:N-acyl-D-aspartate/D-glutamate deacylase